MNFLDLSLLAPIWLHIMDDVLICIFSHRAPQTDAINRSGGSSCSPAGAATGLEYQLGIKSHWNEKDGSLVLELEVPVGAHDYFHDYLQHAIEASSIQSDF